MQFFFVFLFCFFLETVLKHCACWSNTWSNTGLYCWPMRERERDCVCERESEWVRVCVLWKQRLLPWNTPWLPETGLKGGPQVLKVWAPWGEKRDEQMSLVLWIPHQKSYQWCRPPSYKIDMNSRVDSSWTLATLETLHFPEKPWGERNPTSQLPSFDLRFLLLSQPAWMCHLCCCVSSALDRASLASLLFLPNRKPLIDVERLLFALLAKDLTLEAADDLSRAKKLLHSEMSRVFCSWPLPWSLLCSWHIQLLSEINTLKRKDNKYTWVKMVRSCDWNQCIESSDIPSYLLIYGCMVNLLCHLLKAHLRIYLWISQRGWRKPDHGHPCQETVIFVPMKK